MASEGETRARRVPFGELDGKLRTPAEVDKGLACGCVCPNCQARLIAKTSPRGLRFFAHHRTDNCQGGFETALHRMGKQIIVEAAKVHLPAWRCELQERVDLGNDSFPIFDHVLIEGDWSALYDIQSEVNAGRWRPDLTARLPSGETIYIEIVVTHESSIEKASDLENLFEIYLDYLPEEVVINADLLREAVLEEAPRRWLGKSYHDENPLISKKKEKLQQRANREKEKVEARLREQQAMDNKVARDRQIFLEQKTRARQKYSKELNALQQHIHPNQQSKRMSALCEKPNHHKAMKWLQEEFVNTKFHTLHFVMMDLRGAWVFMESPVVWQTWVLFGYLFKHQEGSIINAGEVLKKVKSRYGTLAWMEALSHLKQKEKRDRPSRENGVKSETWFIEAHEIASIVSSYRVMVLFLNFLSSPECSVLETISPGKEYRLKYGSIRRVHEVLAHRLPSIYQQRATKMNSLETMKRLRSMLSDRT